MNSNEKKAFIFIGVIVIVVITIIALIMNWGKNKDGENNQQISEENVVEEKYLSELEDGTKINTSQDMQSVKKYNNLEISNIQFTQKDGSSVILADVKNVGSTTHEMEIVKLTILGENNEVIAEIKPVLGTVKAGETIQFNANVTANVANAKDIKIEANK